MHGQTQPHLQIGGQQQVQPNYAMPLNMQYKFGYSNQPHQINTILFNNRPIAQPTIGQQQQPQPQSQIKQQGQILMQGLQMRPLVQQQIQNYVQPQLQQQNRYNVTVQPIGAPQQQQSQQQQQQQQVVQQQQVQQQSQSQQQSQQQQVVEKIGG